MGRPSGRAPPRAPTPQAGSSPPAGEPRSRNRRDLAQLAKLPLSLLLVGLVVEVPVLHLQGSLVLLACFHLVASVAIHGGEIQTVNDAIRLDGDGALERFRRANPVCFVE